LAFSSYKIWDCDNGWFCG